MIHDNVVISGLLNPFKKLHVFTYRCNRLVF